MSSATSSSNATLYYTAVDDMFKDLLREQEEHEAAEEQAAQQVAESEPWTATPKRLVRIRKHNLFGKDASEEFVICRRLAATQLESSPRSREQQAEVRRLDLLRLRRQRCEVEQKKVTRRTLMRLWEWWWLLRYDNMWSITT